MGSTCEVQIASKYAATAWAVGAGAPLTFILGPCVLESRDHVMRHAEFVAELRNNLPHAQYIFKTSFDKANRTSASSFRGIGMSDALGILAEVGETFGLPLISDVHTPEQVDEAASVLDILQIPAFLCRQTDLLNAAGAPGLPVMIKKGQFLHAADMAYAAEKVSLPAGSGVLLCERGVCFGYRDLVVDFRNLDIMRALGYPVVFDATHSVQSMGGAGGRSGGAREYVFPLARAAVAYGVDAVFMEIHEAPDNAPSDGPNMMPLKDVREVITSLCRIREAI